MALAKTLVLLSLFAMLQAFEIAEYTYYFMRTKFLEFFLLFPREFSNSTRNIFAFTMLLVSRSTRKIKRNT